MRTADTSSPEPVLLRDFLDLAFPSMRRRRSSVDTGDDTDQLLLLMLRELGDAELEATLTEFTEAELSHLSDLLSE